jgi:hypothetical protein
MGYLKFIISTVERKENKQRIKWSGDEMTCDTILFKLEGGGWVL